MLRRLSVPFLVLVMGAVTQGCSSSGTSGTGGSKGTGGNQAAGGHGTGGMGTGGMGTGGKVDSGTDTTATDTPVDMTTATDTSADMSIIDTAGVDADPAATEKATCTAAALADAGVTQAPFSAEEFCTLYQEICAGIAGATVYASQTACRTAYNGFNTNADAGEGPNGQKGCRTAHLCLGYNGHSMASLNTHCPHATGFVEANMDASPGGPCP